MGEEPQQVSQRTAIAPKSVSRRSLVTQPVPATHSASISTACCSILSLNVTSNSSTLPTIKYVCDTWNGSLAAAAISALSAVATLSKMPSSSARTLTPLPAEPSSGSFASAPGGGPTDLCAAPRAQ